MTDNRLDILKALGDNTRYAIYLELARAAQPLATGDIADSLGLHANTVRPHLERMKDVGLLEVASRSTGTVGRPQHRYQVAADAPSLGLEPSVYPALARMLIAMARSAGADAGDAFEAGSEEGRRDAARHRVAGACTDSLLGRLNELGFEPAIIEEPSTDAPTTIGFLHCPFADLAETSPELICSLHHGMVEGFVEPGAESVVEFRTLVDRSPCQVDLTRPAVGVENDQFAHVH